MKPIFLMKTIPWLLGASAVFTLAFSQNVSANTTSNQATSVKQIQNTNVNQANPDQITSRMAYLHHAAKMAIGDSTAKLPTDDGLDNYHAEINAYNYHDENGSNDTSYYKEDYDVFYSLGAAKPFNDQSIKSHYAQLRRHTYNTISGEFGAKQAVGYDSPSDLQGAPRIDLGNGVVGYEVENRYEDMPYWQYSIIWYQGPWEIEIKNPDMIEDTNDPAEWDKTINAAKQRAAAISQANLPQINEHGYIQTGRSNGSALNMTWQEGKQLYDLNTSNYDYEAYNIDADKAAIRMADSLQ